MVESHNWPGSLSVSDEGTYFEIQTVASDGVLIRLQKSPMRVGYYNKDSGQLLVKESTGINWNGSKINETFDCAAAAGQHFFGLGHGTFGKVRSLDRKGKEISRNYGAGWGDGYGHQAPLIVPFYLSTKGYGIFLNSTFHNTFTFCKDGVYQFGIDDGGYGGRMDYFFITGPEFTKILDRYTRLTGRPRLPQRSIFGLQLSDKGHPKNQGEQWWKNKITAHRDAGYPLDHIANDNRWRAGSGAWSGSWFEWDSDRYPDPNAYEDWCQENGLTVTVDLNRNICNDSWGWDPSYNIPNAGCVSHSNSVPDYSSQDVRDWVWKLFWTKSLDPALGYSGDALWIDETDELGCIPDDAILANGRRWAEMENYYLFLVAKAIGQQGWDNKEAGTVPGIGEAKRPFIWIRGMTAGGQRYATHWTGDTYCKYKWMREQVRAMQSSGLSGFAYFNHDAGGFRSPGPDDPMYRQWAMAFGSFSPIWRPHGPGVNGRWPLERSGVCQADALTYSRIRYEMMPYIYTYAYQAYATGMPMARAMVLHYQNVPNAWKTDLQYMWGGEILVAPNCSKGNNNVSVWLPSGNNWYDFWDDTLYNGNQTISYYAETGKLPVFVKDGAIIPKRLFAKSTFWLPKDTLILDVYAGRDGSFNLYEDDGVTERFRTNNENSVTNITFTNQGMKLYIDAANGNYNGKPASRSYRAHFHGVLYEVPMAVNGTTLTKYSTEEKALENGSGYVWSSSEHILSVYTPSYSLSAPVTIKPVGGILDINGDRRTDMADLAMLAVRWLEPDCDL